MQFKKRRFRKNYIGFKAIVVYETRRFLRIWPQSLLPSAITMTLYFVIFGHFIGAKLGTLHGVTYIQFMAPGLIMMAIITNAYGNVAFSLYSDRFQRCIEEILISPLPDYLILLGYALGGMLRGIIVGAIVTLIALFFTHFSIHNITLTIFVVISTSALFALAGFTNALFANKWDDVALIPTFVLTPLIYLGGVFYSITQLPETWQIISKANPILYIINTFRFGMLGISDINISMSMAIIILTMLAFFMLNLYLLKKGIGIRT